MKASFETTSPGPMGTVQRPAGAARPRRRGPRGFWIVAAVLGFSLTAASSPTPLYSVYAARWGFSAITLTVVFAVYAVALLGALLVFGTLSDAIGRKPVIIVALSLQVVSLVCFVAARDVGWLVAARVAQGAATGLISAAVSAALLDLQPRGRPGLGALTNALTSTGGLGAGALGSGALVQYAPYPERLVYVVLLVLALLLLAGVGLLVDETVTDRRRPRLWSRIAVPRAVRPTFFAAVPCLAATLALGGFYLSLGPSLAGDLSHSHNHLLGGGVPAMLCGTGAVAIAVLRSWAPRSCMIVGCTALTSGSALTVVALAVDSPGILYVSTVVAGVGFGVGYLGSFRSLVGLAGPANRGALVAAIYIVLYTAFSIPIVITGVVDTHVGLRDTATGFCAVLAALAFAALVTTLRTPASARSAGRDDPPVSRKEVPIMSPTVLLVHGAFADGSAWNKVMAHLREAGISARAVPNQLRGLTADGEYVASVAAQTEGDVVLVGHSYGGPVVTYAGTSAGNVKALVFVGAFGLDKGENAQDAPSSFPASELVGALQPWSYPGSDVPEFTLRTDKYRSVFAADVTDEEAAAGAANQRPASGTAFGEPLSVEPAWKHLPTWWVIPGADNAINPEYQKATAARIGAKANVLEGGSHSIAVSRSREVADVIIEAARSVS